MFKQFLVGEHVYFFINPKRRSFRVGSYAKIVPRYCRPFEILERIGPVTYKLALDPTMNIHDVFHVSLLKIYVKDVDHVIDCYVL